jgi:putative sigma-54 modulation protein
VEIKVSARHGHLAEETQHAIKDKAQKLLRYFERLTSIDVTVDLMNQEGRHTVEFLARAEHKHDFVAKESHADIMAAVDLIIEKLEHQMRKHKEKIQDHRRTPAMGDVKEVQSP